MQAWVNYIYIKISFFYLEYWKYFKFHDTIGSNCVNMINIGLRTPQGFFSI